MKAVWITPSAPAAPLRRLSRSSTEPRCTSAPAAAREAAPASERARPSTLCPAAINSLTVAEPTNPLAPVTNTRMTNLQMVKTQEYYKREYYCVEVVTLYRYTN